MTQAQRGTGTPRAAGRPRSAEADAAILSAAIDELVERGYEAMTIERIAARAGVARSTVYRRWSSTAELCMEALDSAREHIPQPPGVTVRDDLVFVLRYAHRVVTETRFGRLVPQLAAEARRHPDLTRTYWEKHVGPDRAVFASIIRRGMDTGLIRSDADVDLICDMLVGPLLFRSLWAFMEITDDHITELVDTVLDGLAPTQARYRPGEQPATDHSTDPRPTART